MDGERMGLRGGWILTVSYGKLELVQNLLNVAG